MSEPPQTAAALVAALAADPTEGHLADLVPGHAYHLIPCVPYDLGDAWAVTVVETADSGLLVLPILRSQLGNGHDLYDLTEAFTVPRSAMWRDLVIIHRESTEALLDRLRREPATPVHGPEALR